VLPPNADVLPPLPVEVPLVPGAQPSRAVVVTTQAHSISTGPIERIPLTAREHPFVLRSLQQFSTLTGSSTDMLRATKDTRNLMLTAVVWAALICGLS
jgi:hypothetical protein